MSNTGWDVLAFNEEEETLGVDVPTTEILNARRQRFVERHAVIGYSYGGGATHDLIESLYNEDNDDNGDPDNIVTNVGVFLDAVDQFGINAENDWPDVAFYLLNLYQEIPFQLGGADINDNDVLAGAAQKALPEAKEQLAKLAERDQWWVRLYVAEIMRRHRELRLPDVLEKLKGDENESVSKTAKSVKE